MSVNFSTANGTATIANSDYAASSGNLNFAAGLTSQTLTISVVGDKRQEANETFFVNLSSPTDATIADAQGLGKILNDDGGNGKGPKLLGSRSLVASESNGVTVDSIASFPGGSGNTQPLRGTGTTALAKVGLKSSLSWAFDALPTDLPGNTKQPAGVGLSSGQLAKPPKLVLDTTAEATSSRKAATS